MKATLPATNKDIKPVIALNARTNQLPILVILVLLLLLLSVDLLVFSYIGFAPCCSLLHTLDIVIFLLHFPFMFIIKTLNSKIKSRAIALTFYLKISFYPKTYTSFKTSIDNLASLAILVNTTKSPSCSNCAIFITRIAINRTSSP